MKLLFDIFASFFLIIGFLIWSVFEALLFIAAVFPPIALIAMAFVGHWAFIFLAILWVAIVAVVTDKYLI